MSGKKIKKLGIIYVEESDRGLTHPYFVLILDSFKAEAEAQGCEITFVNTKVIGDELNYVQYCRESGLDAVCIVCEDFGSERIRDLVYSEIPCLTIDHLFKRVAAVLSDNETGVRTLVECAISRGHRRIAFIHGHNNSVVTRARLMQFRNTMAFRQIPITPGYILEGRYDDIQLTRKLVTQLLNLPERPTCILLPDDISYLGAQDAARECSLRIPDEISFAGYDGIPMTQALSPRLTTIHQDSAKIGRMAARRLIDLVDHPDTASRLPAILSVDFIEGGTMGYA